MLPYFLLFALVSTFALTQMRVVTLGATPKHWSGSWWMVFWIFTLMIGMRYEVGGDWGNYFQQVDELTNVAFDDISWAGMDPAYTTLNWLGSHWGGVYLVNIICSTLFTIGLIVFCRTQPLPWLALTVAIPYLVMVVAMGYTRQSVAIGLSMLALVAVSKGKALHFAVWIAAAALFHKSAVILVPLAILAGSKRIFWVIAWTGIVGTLLFVLLLQESIDSLTYGYLELEYQSSGAGVRIAMNALPALIFLILRKHFSLPSHQNTFWSWVAVLALGFIGLLSISPSSTAVDRVALYWIPLQLFVLSRLPISLGRLLGYKNVWICLVVTYSATVQIVWLTFADLAFSWLPYRFYPWVWAWQ